MVKASRSRSFTLLAVAAALTLAGCQTPEPMQVEATFAPTPGLVEVRPAHIAVLPIENGTPDGAIARHLTYLRQEVERQLVDRHYTALDSSYVDAIGPMPAGESLLTPATLAKVAGRDVEEAVLAVRVQRWDESRLLTDHTVAFQFDAVMAGRKGEVLWNGSMQGVIKAGGSGAAPREPDRAAQSCIHLAVEQMLQRLPMRQNP